MEVKTQLSRTAVNSGAKAGDAMPTLQNDGSQLGAVEDLGGPTPENYKPDDDSAKLKEPGGTLKQVKDVVNKGAKPAMAKEEEELDTEATIEEEETPSFTPSSIKEDAILPIGVLRIFALPIKFEPLSLRDTIL